MTNSEIKNALIEYAKKDTQIAIENGSMAITDTKSGIITLNCEYYFFQAFNIMGEKLTDEMSQGKMIEWLTTQYEVEIAA